jgi:uncharacterized membrane protein YphA (DoxX/SURF4 family)
MFLINLFDGTIFFQLIIMAFLAILFLQSGLDKVFKYKANHAWITNHFAKTPLKNTIKILFPLITITEVLAGVFSLGGIGVFLLNESTKIGLIGAELAALCIVMLFLGQRIAKDYAGAATLTQYFIVSLIAIYMLT